MLPSEIGFSGAEYVVKFNPAIAWTLEYEDSLGSLIFVFEIGETPQTIILDPTPLENNRVVHARDTATRARIDLAFQRTRAFLVSCGYDVNI
jgi:hypothetical protein